MLTSMRKIQTQAVHHITLTGADLGRAAVPDQRVLCYGRDRRREEPTMTPPDNSEPGTR